MKKRYAAIVFCLLLAGCLFFLFHARPPAVIPPTTQPAGVLRATFPAATSPPSATLSGNVAPPAAATVAAPNNLAAQAGQVIPDPNPPPVLPPETVLQNLHRAIHEYGQMFGGNPVGTNPEITAALTGRNPKGINFLRGEPGLTVNANGELIDPWGTPYFFHQISGSDTELHSAGPDHIIWTPDDLVIK